MRSRTLLRTLVPITAKAAALLALLAPLVLALWAAPPPARACTNFLVTQGASADGSTMITYAADSHDLYGELYYIPRGQHGPGSRIKVVEWDTGKDLGTIPQAPVTYRVVGNMNEHAVAIGETTFGGREELENPKGGLDYGSLMWLALQRSKTAREAISVIVALTEEHGYKSGGESFSIADPKEVWLMEMVGKGPGSKGMLWVALRVPEGYVTAHANQPRIRTFPRNDPENALYAEDVVSFARAKGWFDGKDEDFSFQDVYAPATCRDLRIRDGRVWAFYRRVAPSQNFGPDWMLCRPGAKPLPLWIKPDRKLSAKDLMELMRDHFQGTEFDMSKGIGAGPFGLPYRWRPLTWKVDGREYLHERTTATQQTGYSFVSQSRQGMPGIVAGLLWFSVDDTMSTVHVPMYAGLTQIPKPYAVGTASFTKFSWDSAFWVFNWVANFAYSRYRDIIKDIQVVQRELEDGFMAAQARVETEALAIYRRSPAEAEAFLTNYSTQAADKVMTRWRRLGEELLVRYLDGNVRDAKGKVTHPPYPEDWYRRIVAESGDLFLAEGKPGEPPRPTAYSDRGQATTAAAAPSPATPGAPGSLDPAKPTASATPMPTGTRVPSTPTKACGGCAQGGSDGAGTPWTHVPLGLLPPALGLLFALAVARRRRRRS